MHKITFTNSTNSGLALTRNEQLGPSLKFEDPYSPNISVTHTEIQQTEKQIRKDSG